MYKTIAFQLRSRIHLPLARLIKLHLNLGIFGLLRLHLPLLRISESAAILIPVLELHAQQPVDLRPWNFQHISHLKVRGAHLRLETLI